ncbi:hypothetical protein [Mycobacterium sp. NPDC004974]
MIIKTAFGEARVLHRLALAVDCADAVTHSPLGTQVRIGAEVAPRLRTYPDDVTWPCADLLQHGLGRATRLHRPPMPANITVRIADPTRRYVPRRLTTPLRTDADITASDNGTGPYIPVGSRELRPWLSPGSAYQMPRSTTAIRGRVMRGATAARWPRITAIGPGGQAVGWAHGDDRGEFVLVIVSTGSLHPPAPSTLAVTLVVTAPANPPTVTEDPLADLVVETVPQSQVPPVASDLNSPLLQGRTTPPGYITSATPTNVTVPVGITTQLPTAVPFTV